MHVVLERIADGKARQLADAVDEGETQTGGAFLLAAFEERFEDFAFVERLGRAGVADAESVFGEHDADASAVHVVHEGVLQQVGHQRGGKHLVHLEGQSLLFVHLHRDVTVIIHFFVVLQITCQDVVKAHGARLGELLVFDFRQQEERLVQLRDVFQRVVRLGQFFQLSFADGLVFHHHLQAVAADGQRRLQLVRGVADEAFLLLEELFVARREEVGRVIECAEFGDGILVVQRLVALAHVVVAQPAKQAVERLHAVVEHTDVEHDDDDKQRGVEDAHPDEDGVFQVTLLDGRCHHNQQKVFVPVVLEDGLQDAGRLGLAFFLDVDHLVAVFDARMSLGVLVVHPRHVILVVRTIVFGWQFLAGQGADDDGLGVVFQRVVRLVIDFVNHGEIKKHGPRGHDDRDGYGQAQGDV